jgi:hypothetical protein
VDFPDPDGPVRAIRARDGIRQLTSRTACTAATPEPKVRLTTLHSATTDLVVVPMAASRSAGPLVI